MHLMYVRYVCVLWLLVMYVSMYVVCVMYVVFVCVKECDVCMYGCM